MTRTPGVSFSLRILRASGSLPTTLELLSDGEHCSPHGRGERQERKAERRARSCLFLKPSASFPRRVHPRCPTSTPWGCLEALCKTLFQNLGWAALLSMPSWSSQAAPMCKYPPAPILARGFSRVAAAFSSYDGDLSLPLGLALGSPIFPSGCEGKLGDSTSQVSARRTSHG